MTQLDVIAQHPDDDGCPSSPAFRRELVIRIARELFRQRLLGVPRRPRGRTAA